MNAQKARENMVHATATPYLVALRSHIDSAIDAASKAGRFALENPWEGSLLQGNTVAIERVLDSLKADGFGVTYLSDQLNPATPLHAVVDWQVRKQTGELYDFQAVRSA